MVVSNYGVTEGMNDAQHDPAAKPELWMSQLHNKRIKSGSNQGTSSYYNKGEQNFIHGAHSIDWKFSKATSVSRESIIFFTVLIL